MQVAGPVALLSGDYQSKLTIVYGAGYIAVAEFTLNITSVKGLKPETYILC
jgi:hypothetical protein